MFEEISSTVRKGNYAPPSLPEEGEAIITPEAKEKQLAWTDKVSKLFKPEGIEDNPDITYPDLMEEASVFAWAGVNFGPEETYRLMLSIKQLSMVDNLSYKFWGKVITRSGDYYICFTEAPDEPDDLDPKVMEGKMGLNKYTYCVCKFAGDAWTKLPLCTPEMIVVARKIRRFFTGDLDAPVPCYPPFPSGGTEAYLLRAMVAEITSATHIAPDGFFMEGDESDEGYKTIAPVDPEEFKESYVPSLDAFKDAGMWDKYKALVTVSVNFRARIYGDRFRAILIALPEMFEHMIQQPSEFKSLNRKFPTAMNTDWRIYRDSKRYVAVLIEDSHIEQLVLLATVCTVSYDVVCRRRNFGAGQ